MAGLESAGRLLLLLGGITFLVGLLLILAPRVPYLGHLPGDVYLRRGSFSFYFPLATSVLISIGLTLLLNVFLRLFRG